MRENLERRRREKRQQLSESLSQARCDAANIIDHIWRKHRPVRIYQWGSLVHGDHFSERSDIDIALEGITDPKAFFAVIREAESMTSFPLDIVQMETIHPAYAESIRERGVVVRE